MVEGRLQKIISKQGRNRYMTYVVTLPKVIVEVVPDLAKTKKFEVEVDNGKIVLKPRR
jgi:hypothetical protein